MAYAQCVMDILGIPLPPHSDREFIKVTCESIFASSISRDSSMNLFKLKLIPPFTHLVTNSASIVVRKSNMFS